MTDEFTMSGLLKIDKDFLVDQKVVSNLRLDQTGDGAVGGVQNIGTSAEAIALGDVSDPGLYFFRNLDPDNYVEIGMAVGGGAFEKMDRIRPGGIKIGELDLVATGVLQAKADTAAIELQYKIYER